MCGARGHRNGKTRTSFSTTTKPRFTGPLKFRSFWPRTIWQWSPIPHSHLIWSPVILPLPQAEASDEGSKIWRHWRDSRGIAAGTWHNSKKELPGMLPSMAETLEPLYSCKRGVLWRWCRNLTSKLSKHLFTSTLQELLDTLLYKRNEEWLLRNVKSDSADIEKVQCAGAWYRYGSRHQCLIMERFIHKLYFVWICMWLEVVGMESCVLVAHSDCQN